MSLQSNLMETILHLRFPPLIPVLCVKLENTNKHRQRPTFANEMKNDIAEAVSNYAKGLALEAQGNPLTSLSWKYRKHTPNYVSLFHFYVWRSVPITVPQGSVSDPILSVDIALFPETLLCFPGTAVPVVNTLEPQPGSALLSFCPRGTQILIKQPLPLKFHNLGECSSKLDSQIGF